VPDSISSSFLISSNADGISSGGKKARASK